MKHGRSPSGRPRSVASFPNVVGPLEKLDDAEETSPLLAEETSLLAVRSKVVSTDPSSPGPRSSLFLNSLSLSKDLIEGARQMGLNYWLRFSKGLILFTITVICTVTFILDSEDPESLRLTFASTTPKLIHSERTESNFGVLRIRLQGPLEENGDGNLSASVRLYSSSNESWTLDVNNTMLEQGEINEFDYSFGCQGNADGYCNISVVTSGAVVPLAFTVRELTDQVEFEIIYAALVLVFVYVLIIFDLVHRTLAATVGALAVLAVLSAIHERPIIDKIIEWLDMDTLMLLFGMMIIVAVISETGIFDYLALKAYRLARGKVWPLITLLCVFSGVLSAFLDNVTTILLMAPVTIKLCEVLNLDPRVILIAEVLFSNIGGTATGIGDPPNVIIINCFGRRVLLSVFLQGITFSNFTAHMSIGIIFVAVVSYGFLRLYYRKMRQIENPDPPEIAELQHEIEMWRRAASRVVVVTREETLMRALFLQKVAEQENQLNRTLHRKRKEEIKDFNEQITQLEKEYYIRDWKLLLKCGGVLLVVLAFFFMYSFVPNVYVGIGWIAVLGAIVLLVLADINDLESILHKVEWPTLLFFAALFILMEALGELNLITWIGDQMKEFIKSIDKDQRLTIAIVIIVWVSALVSSFIDNIPYTTAMVPILRQLSEDADVELPLLPLAASLAFGACLGGNGTLIGASANVVCAGIAEQHGYDINFRHFFKVGFPMMLVTVSTATVYLLIVHSAIGWNEASSPSEPS
ncbi:hypothetical protein C0Q70_05735 [Pomacea canaliculata]|uniref:Citrate transporter-like domain-containing protein n=1 Tax=Pomacea canaliculata TaxID=400727 RepID=A0A2T7PM14_POMCA|nr:hypothetical protein C0Q70_05735 [Pomacea canaliculata]